MEIFFTNHGHGAMVIADNKDDYKSLAKWADTIEPLKEAASKKD